MRPSVRIRSDRNTGTHSALPTMRRRSVLPILFPARRFVRCDFRRDAMSSECRQWLYGLLAFGLAVAGHGLMASAGSLVVCCLCLTAAAVGLAACCLRSHCLDSFLCSFIFAGICRPRGSGSSVRFSKSAADGSRNSRRQLCLRVAPQRISSCRSCLQNRRCNNHRRYLWRRRWHRHWGQSQHRRWQHRPGWPAGTAWSPADRRPSAGLRYRP